MSVDPDVDTRFRISAFDYLAKLTLGSADIPVRWNDLINFRFEGSSQPLIGQRGIWKPKIVNLPISIATACWPDRIWTSIETCACARRRR